MAIFRRPAGSARRGSERGRDPAPWSDSEARPILSIVGASKRFSDAVAVDDVSLDVHRGEFFSLLGGSGCGKTTLLRLLAGFEEPDAGRIVIDGVDMADVPPHRRPVNMMFQSYALFPHMSVARNVGYGLRQEGVGREEIRARVAEMLDLVQLGAFARRRPDQLSGGQRQRVALARALIKRPKVLLLDEPLAALDKKLRAETQFELVALQERLGATFVIVTHDQEEAMTMSSRIAVMNEGRIVQVGRPAEIYEFPNSRFVARFVGLVNLFEGRVEAVADGRVRARAEGFEAPLEAPVPAGDSRAWLPGESVAVAVRPEKVAIRLAGEADAVATGAANRAVGQVRDIAYLGDVSIYHVDVGGGRTVIATEPNLRHVAEAAITWDDRVALAWPADSAVVLDG